MVSGMPPRKNTYVRARLCVRTYIEDTYVCVSPRVRTYKKPYLQVSGSDFDGQEWEKDITKRVHSKGKCLKGPGTSWKHRINPCKIPAIGAQRKHHQTARGFLLYKLLSLLSSPGKSWPASSHCGNASSCS